MLTFVSSVEHSPRSRSPKNDVNRGALSPKPLSGEAGQQNNTRPDSKREFGLIHEGGQSRMIEDMYGVERRESQPLKRVMVDIDKRTGSNADMKDKISRFNKTSLGEYMKDDSDQYGATPAPPVANAIDLTSDNEDDDVIFVANRDLGAEEVCYGKIEGAMVHAHQVPTPPRTIFKDMAHSWPSIKCELFRERSQNIRIEVKDPANKVFGVVDPKTSTALAPLLDSGVAKFRAQARLDVRKRQADEWPGQPCFGSFSVSINLYGPRRLTESTGRFLGQKNIWLGVPNAVEAGISVCNPHTERRLAIAANTPSNRFSVQSETRTAEEINSAVTRMFDQLRSAQNLPEKDPPEMIKTPLLAHQKQALWYMMEKEKPRQVGTKEEDNNSLWRVQYQPNGRKLYREIISGVTCTEEPPQVFGGLLADMMGLGKTLSILSLVCSSLPQSVEWSKEQLQNKSLLNNAAIRNAKTTLLVSPLSAVGNWVNQIKEHLQEGSISYYVFHGPSRTEDPTELAKYDLVITTYSTVLSDLSRKSAKRGLSPLAQLNFFRIVLDEAHAIREQSTAQSQAIFSLEAQRRWSVTGTPIQNRLEDLGSVAKFLRLYPYNEKGRFAAHIISPFKCENPNAITTLRVFIDSFTLRRLKDRIDLPPRHDQTVLLTFSENEKALHEFFRKESNVLMNVIAGQAKEKMSGKMYHLVLKAMMVLRQISAHGKELLDQEDRERFKGLTANDAIDLEEFENNATDSAERKAYEMLSLMKESSADVCVKCGNFIALQSGDESAGDKTAMAAAMLPCYDILCADCFSRLRQVFDDNAGKPVQLKCVFCKNLIAPIYTVITSAGFEKYQATQLASKQNRKQVKVLGQYEGPHTKTKALMSHLLSNIEESKRNPDQPPIKSVVFSSWTSHLDLIEIALQDNGIISFTRLDGTMVLKQRNAALDAFRADNNITILLATLGAGGVGLNLTSASRVYVMEPQYNPAAVAQAIDRVHRLGQTREVTTVQFIMKDSIEEKIAELAKKKQKLANMSLNRGKSEKREMMEERMQEYRSLFK
ncbi:DEAD-like helicase superfamily protein [Emydomyces testavorans]|uniref:DEAD-like helicase superfamily protein n=1 Tax=Emydomyces testavorans TaxID=2070801 RepID=A0AAF0IGT6_9EURO|nr:DEAD-like helicase superfamily protein [Emydomyces testavorans]